VILYFAYGSNMDPARLFETRMAEKGIRWGSRVAARLDGWCLAFDKPWAKYDGAGVANIRPDSKGIVHGTLNELGDGGLEALDIHEGVASGHYARHRVTVIAPQGRVEAITYVASAPPVAGLKPHSSYLAHLLAGRDLLPPSYFATLAAISVADAQR
jgi:gamma-glutamylcyclotransferase (GGCT)/AIG2-like uncharacterized protein YtfP